MYNPRKTRLTYTTRKTCLIKKDKILSKNQFFFSTLKTDTKLGDFLPQFKDIKNSFTDIHLDQNPQLLIY